MNSNSNNNKNSYFNRNTSVFLYRRESESTELYMLLRLDDVLDLLVL